MIHIKQILVVTNNYSFIIKCHRLQIPDEDEIGAIIQGKFGDAKIKEIVLRPGDDEPSFFDRAKLLTKWYTLSAKSNATIDIW